MPVKTTDRGTWAAYGTMFGRETIVFEHVDLFVVLRWVNDREDR